MGDATSASYTAASAEPGLEVGVGPKACSFRGSDGDAFTRWAGVGGGPDAVARYEYSSQQLVFACQIALILLATFVLFWKLGQGSGNVKRPAAFAGGDARRQPAAQQVGSGGAPS